MFQYNVVGHTEFFYYQIPASAAYKGSYTMRDVGWPLTAWLYTMVDVNYYVTATGVNANIGSTVPAYVLEGHTYDIAFSRTSAAYEFEGIYELIDGNLMPLSDGETYKMNANNASGTLTATGSSTRNKTYVVVYTDPNAAPEYTLTFKMGNEYVYFADDHSFQKQVTSIPEGTAFGTATGDLDLQVLHPGEWSNGSWQPELPAALDPVTSSAVYVYMPKYGNGDFVLTVTPDSQTYIYDGLQKAINTYTHNLPSGYTLSNVLLTGNTGTNAGEYTVQSDAYKHLWAVRDGSSNNVSSLFTDRLGETGLLKISPRSITLSLPDYEDYRYDGVTRTQAQWDADVTASELIASPMDALVYSAKVTGQGGAVYPKGTPWTDVQAMIPVPTPNSASSYFSGWQDPVPSSGTVQGNQTFTAQYAAKKALVLEANSGSKTYDGTDLTVSGFTSSVNGLVITGIEATGSARYVMTPGAVFLIDEAPGLGTHGARCALVRPALADEPAQAAFLILLFPTVQRAFADAVFRRQCAQLLGLIGLAGFTDDVRREYRFLEREKLVQLCRIAFHIADQVEAI